MKNTSTEKRGRTLVDITIHDVVDTTENTSDVSRRKSCFQNCQNMSNSKLYRGYAGRLSHKLYFKYWYFKEDLDKTPTP